MTNEFGQSPKESDNDIARRLLEDAGFETKEWSLDDTAYTEKRAFTEALYANESFHLSDYAGFEVETTMHDELVTIAYTCPTDYGPLCEIKNWEGASMRVVLAGSVIVSDDSVLSDKEFEAKVNKICLPEYALVPQVHAVGDGYVGYIPGALLRGGYCITRAVFTDEEIMEESRVKSLKLAAGIPNFAYYVGHSDIETTLFIHARPAINPGKTSWAKVRMFEESESVSFGSVPKE